MASESRFPLSPRKPGAEDERRPRTRVEDENALEKVYHMGDILGQGSFGVVREATHHTTGKKFAIKAVSKDKVSEIIIYLLIINQFHSANESDLVRLLSLARWQSNCWTGKSRC